MLGRWLLTVLLMGPAVGAGRAQGPLSHIGLPGENGSTARRLAALDKLIAEDQGSEAVAEILHILDEVGDDLVPLDPRHCIQARWLCHLRLASPTLPPTIRRFYRDRVDGQVKKWWDQAEATYDVRLLRRIVQEAFCSRFADRALDVLGDLAFERGDFEEAGSWWRLLAPEGDQRGPTDLVFPDPEVDVARVRAKLLLLRLAQGNRDGMDQALQAYKNLHGQAQGELAGRKGKYLETLQAFVRQPALLTPVLEDPPWTTFAGNPSRNQLIPKAPSPYLVETSPIPIHDPRANRKKLGAGKGVTRTLAVYPVIAGGQVLIADAHRVIGYELSSGRLSGRYDLQEDRKSGFQTGVEEWDPRPQAGPRYTLTVAGRHIYVRLGNLAVVGSDKKNKRSTGPDSFLVCLDLQADPQGRFPRRWLVAAPAPKEEQAITVFEGSPLVHEGRVYVARARITGTQVATAIECYNAAQGTLHWRQDVCETREFSDGAPRFHQHLLTLAGPNVVYCSHSGAILAVDTVTGRRSWAVRYRSRGLKTATGPSPRDLAPCLYAGGRLFVAPADADRILCLEATTGRLLWESQRVEVVHLLGLAKGKLIFTTGIKPRGLQAADAATGKLLIDWLIPATGDGELASLGRGFLAGDKVYWPTRDLGLCVLSQQDGQPDPADNYYFRQRFGQALGNLAFGEGCLAIATPDQLRVFVPAARRLEEFRKDAAAQPDSAVSRYRLALAEMDAHLSQAALSSLALVEKQAARDDRWEGISLCALARSRRHQVLLDLANQARSQEQWKVAADYLDQATGTTFPVSHRLRALAQLADLWSSAGQPARAVEVWQSILTDDLLRRGQVVTADTIPHHAGTYAATQIDELIRAHGRGIYAVVEKRARAVASLQGERPAEVVQRLTREFPNAAVSQMLPLRKPLSQPEPEPTLPNLELPLIRSWAIAWGEAERLVEVEGKGGTSSGADFFVLARGSEITCRDAATGKPRWLRAVGGPPIWIGRHADCLLTAWSQGVASLSLADGMVWWEFLAPPDREGVEPSRSSLGHFQLAAGRLFFLQDERRLFALEVDSGRIQWSQWAPAAHLARDFPGGRFHPLYHASKEWVVIQTSGGRRLVLASPTGRRSFASDTPFAAWSRPPLALDERRLCLVQGQDQVALFDPAVAKDVWLRQTGKPSIFMQAPQVFGDAANLFQLVDGWQLEQLDPATGQARWARGLGTAPVVATRAAFDRKALYFVSGQILQARSLADGRRLWDFPLPDRPGSWRTILTRQYLIVFPADLSSRTPWVALFDARPMIAPIIGIYPGLFPTTARPRDFPILICDPAEGKLIQRLNFTVPGPPPTVQFFDGGMVVILAAAAWGLKS
jgi:outer membrane protein assembly factor BamB